MGIIDFYDTVHIQQCKASEAKIVNANATAHCEWGLRVTLEQTQIITTTFSVILPLVFLGFSLSIMIRF